MACWSIFIQGVDPIVVFSSYYYSSAWQQVFAVDNSFILWGIGLGLALMSRHPAAVAFAGAGLLHLAFDFPVHNHDARMHFWPLTDWVFISPFSYWDSRFHAGIVGRIELGLVLICTVMLLRRFRFAISRALICVLAVLEIIAAGAFGWFF